MEIADIFVVNQADREGADRLVQAIAANQALQPAAAGRMAAPDPQDGRDDRRRHRRALGGDRAVPRALEQRRRRPPASATGLSAAGTAVAAVPAASSSDPCLPASSIDSSIASPRASSIRTGRPRSAGGRTQMKAILDHIGIAVEDIDAALAFYRDALGLEIEAPEEVASQRVRAHVIPTGESALELLEATAPGFADREIPAEARPRDSSHHPARGRHPRGARASPRAGSPADRRAAAPGRPVGARGLHSSRRPRMACSSS